MFPVRQRKFGSSGSRDAAGAGKEIHGVGDRGAVTVGPQRVGPVGRGDLCPQLVDPLLQPGPGAASCLVLGVELIVKVDIGDGVRDGIDEVSLRRALLDDEDVRLPRSGRKSLGAEEQTGC